jgi:nitrogen-specific signal transduction histidine kinase
MNKCHKDFCHEISNHLQAIEGYAFLIHQAESLKQTRDYTQKLMDKVDQMITFVRTPVKDSDK